MARKGIATPLDEFIAAEEDWKSSGLASALMGAGKVGEKTYALPFESGTPTLFFNLDLVRRAGGDPNNLPQDWDGIIAKLKTLCNADIRIMPNCWRRGFSGRDSSFSTRHK